VTRKETRIDRDLFDEHGTPFFSPCGSCCLLYTATELDRRHSNGYGRPVIGGDGCLFPFSLPLLPDCGYGYVTGCVSVPLAGDGFFFSPLSSFPGHAAPTQLPGCISNGPVISSSFFPLSYALLHAVGERGYAGSLGATTIFFSFPPRSADTRYMRAMRSMSGHRSFFSFSLPLLISCAHGGSANVRSVMVALRVATIFFFIFIYLAGLMCGVLGVRINL